MLSDSEAKRLYLASTPNSTVQSQLVWPWQYMQCSRRLLDILCGFRIGICVFQGRAQLNKSDGAGWIDPAINYSNSQEFWTNFFFLLFLLFVVLFTDSNRRRRDVVHWLDQIGKIMCNLWWPVTNWWHANSNGSVYNQEWKVSFRKPNEGYSPYSIGKCVRSYTNDKSRMEWSQ